MRTAPLVTLGLLVLGPAALAQYGVGPRIGVIAECCAQTPGAAVARDGSFVIVWETALQHLDIDYIQARRYGPDGRPRGAFFFADPEHLGFQSSPRIAAATDGSFVVSWLQFDEGGSRDLLYARRFDSYGRPRGPRFRVGTGPVANEGFFDDLPALASAPDGGFVAVWQRALGEPDGRRQLFFRVFSAAGAALGPEVLVDTLDRGPVAPAVAMDGRGRFVIVWLQDPGGGPRLIYRLFSPHGRALGGPYDLRSESGGVPSAPSVAMAADGRFLASWVETDSSHEVVQTRVVGRAFDARGVAETGDLSVTGEQDGVHSDPATAWNPSGGFVVVWRHTRPVGFCRYKGQRYRAGSFRANFLVSHEFGCEDERGLAIGLGEDGKGVVVFGASDYTNTFITARRLGPRPVDEPAP